jgi:hypothetical protein
MPHNHRVYADVVSIGTDQHSPLSSQAWHGRHEARLDRRRGQDYRGDRAGKSRTNELNQHSFCGVSSFNVKFMSTHVNHDEKTV